MRVALISTSCIPVPPPRYGGTELIIAELAHALVRLGHEVTTFATGDSHPSGTLRAHFRQAKWPPDPYMDLVHAHDAFRQLRSGRTPVDVVHAHTAVSLAFASALDAPTVYTVHHCRSENLIELYEYFDDAEYVMISARQRLLHPELPRAHVVYHGIDPARYIPGDGRGGYVAFLGRFAPEKAPHVAIEAAGRAGVPIVLAGEAHPQAREYFDRFVAPRLSDPGVRWIGEADRERKQSLLAGARALMFPVDWEEPFGLVMLEAMLCGTPVIAFDRGSVPEIVEDGTTGFIVRSVEDMAEAVLRSSQLDRARIRVRAEERFSAVAMAERYLGVYRTAVSRRALRQSRPPSELA